MKRCIAAVLSGTVMVSGCAEKSEQVSPTYISPMQYQSYSCSQVQTEAQRVSARVGEVAGVQDKQANNDAVATGVALVLFWPAAFFIKGNKDNAAKLGRLKGEMEALEQASIQKGCGLEFRKA